MSSAVAPELVCIQADGSLRSIPGRLNLAISLLVSVAALGLLSLASHLDNWYAITAVAVIFAFVMLTNYGVMHEAEHELLFRNHFWNEAFGRWHAWLFPSAFTLLRTTHLGHHRRNRSDTEMFDLYYPSDSRWLKFAQWYGILFGFFWLMAPIGAVVMSLRPPERFLSLFTWARTTRRWITDFQAAQVSAIRWETLAGIGVWIVLWQVLDLRWQSVVLCYALAGFNWSTRQYIEHAYANRDVIDGTHNLRCAAWLSCLLLHHEWHLNHHRQPNVPWCYLPQLSASGETRPSYGRAYLRLWQGPRMIEEIASASASAPASSP